MLNILSAKLIVIKTVELTGKAKGRGVWYKKQT